MKMSKKIASSVILSIVVVDLIGLARAAESDLVPLDLNLPQAAFKGTPQNIQTNTYTEPYPDLDKPAEAHDGSRGPKESRQGGERSSRATKTSRRKSSPN